MWKYLFDLSKLTKISQSTNYFLNNCVIIVEDKIYLNLALDLSFLKISSAKIYSSIIKTSKYTTKVSIYIIRQIELIQNKTKTMWKIQSDHYFYKERWISIHLTKIVKLRHNLTNVDSIW